MSLARKRKSHHLGSLRWATEGPRLISAYVDLVLAKWKLWPGKRRSR